MADTVTQIIDIFENKYLKKQQDVIYYEEILMLLTMLLEGITELDSTGLALVKEDYGM